MTYMLVSITKIARPQKSGDFRVGRHSLNFLVDITQKNIVEHEAEDASYTDSDREHNKRCSFGVVDTGQHADQKG